MDKLRILGNNIKVIYQHDMAREFSRSGHYDCNQKQIKISSDANKQHRDMSLLHEILEVLDMEMELNLAHDEQLCKLEVGLWQIFRDNPHLLKIFKE